MKNLRIRQLRSAGIERGKKPNERSGIQVNRSRQLRGSRIELNFMTFKNFMNFGWIRTSLRSLLRLFVRLDVSFEKQIMFVLFVSFVLLVCLFV